VRKKNEKGSPSSTASNDYGLRRKSLIGEIEKNVSHGKEIQSNNMNMSPYYPSREKYNQQCFRLNSLINLS
jgi:hypothetical protein